MRSVLSARPCLHPRKPAEGRGRVQISCLEEARECFPKSRVRPLGRLGDDFSCTILSNVKGDGERRKGEKERKGKRKKTAGRKDG